MKAFYNTSTTDLGTDDTNYGCCRTATVQAYVAVTDMSGVNGCKTLQDGATASVYAASRMVYSSVTVNTKALTVGSPVVVPLVWNNDFLLMAQMQTTTICSDAHRFALSDTVLTKTGSGLAMVGAKHKCTFFFDVAAAKGAPAFQVGEADKSTWEL